MADKDSEGRTRFTYHKVLRDPNGPILRQNEGPVGLRAPNGFIWAHDLDEFFYIARIPGVDNYVTTWSRSMLKALGENYEDVEAELMWEDPLHPPRVRRPWPVLTLPLDHPAQPDPPISAIDEACEWEHSDFMCYTIRADGSGYLDEDKQAYVDPRKVPRRCPADASKPCTGRLAFNNGADPILDTSGVPYHFVWCPHFKAKLSETTSVNPYTLIARAVVEMESERMIVDTKGVHLLAQRRHPQIMSDAPSEKTTPPPDSSKEALNRHEDAADNDVPNNQLSAHGEDETLDAPESGKNIPVDVRASTPQDDASTPQCESSTEVSNGPQSPASPQTRSQKNRKKYRAKQKDATRVNKFSVKGLPKLEEFIPDALLPDVLLVHDPDRTTGHEQATDQPVTYRRVIHRLSGGVAATEVTTDAPRVAHLHLRANNRLGEGHHSYVYRAPLTLPEPLSAHSRTGQVTVAAKLAFGWCTAHDLLHNEARTYAQVPRHAQEEYCGFNIVPPCRFPVPIGPIVPKCYGFYLPVGEDGKIMWNKSVSAKHRGCDEDAPCEVDWLSPILLMEECGQPVQPEKFTIDQRTECFSLVLRLHALGITQRSFWVRNIMIQPGPLWVPPARRTFDCPSFRIIDFGRARCLKLRLADKGLLHGEGVKADVCAKVVSDFKFTMQTEERKAREQLLIEECEF
ncbi:hypothetical protein BC628DRAFT_1525296 [Trametes gibbosa]|nr:hypothetical protein BC628DRAFT_1525296 [Trametes gibbosa]